MEYWDSKHFLRTQVLRNFQNVTEEDLRKAMPIIAKHGLPLLVHCELSTPTHPSPITNHHPRSYTNYCNQDPKKWEDEAIA